MMGGVGMGRHIVIAHYQAFHFSAPATFTPFCGRAFSDL